MNRKNTILIAVMVNASLLVLLFITALTTQEEIFIGPSMQMLGSATSQGRGTITDSPKPLFEESSDRTLMQVASSEGTSPSSKSLGSTCLRQEEVLADASKPHFEESSEQMKKSTNRSDGKLSANKSAEPIAEVPVLHALPSRIEESSNTNSLASSSSSSVRSTPSASSSEVKSTTPIRSAQNTGSTSPGYKVVIVKKGDTLDKIAKEHFTSVDEIIKMNQLPSSFLRIGQSLKISVQGQNNSSQQPKSITAKESDSVTYYTVKVGDNPWTIATKHHIKLEELLRLNGLNEEKARKLKPGDRLRTR